MCPLISGQICYSLNCNNSKLNKVISCVFAVFQFGWFLILDAHSTPKAASIFHPIYCMKVQIDLLLVHRVSLMTSVIVVC